MLGNWYGVLARNSILPLLLWRAGESQRLRYYREFLKSQYRSPEEIASRQRQQFEKLVAHAYQNCPYYQERFDRAGLTAAEFGDPSRLPILSKRDIQARRDDMVAKNWPAEDLIRDQTGGSTAEPISFYLSRDRYESRVAAMWRHDQWAGHLIGNKVAYVWGAPQDLPSSNWKARLRNRLFGGQIWLDTSDVTEDKMLEFGQSLKKFRPPVIIAYANAMVMLAAFFRDRKITPYQPQSIITSAELLTPSGRELIESTFGCPVYNRYGCREFSVIASECELHDGMHIMAEGLLVEVDPQSMNEEGCGDLLVTDLLNFAMPMIRYRIGDRGSLMEGACSCGRGLPRLNSIEGRVTDFLVGDRGQLVSGVFVATYVVAQRPELGRVQFVQHRQGEVLVRIQPGPGFEQDQGYRYLTEATQRHLGSGTQVQIEQVDQMLMTRSGKLQFSISHALPDFAEIPPA